MSEEFVDRKIQEALARSSSDIEVFANQQSLLHDILQIFKGRNWWINSIMVVVTLAIFVLCIYSGVRFYHATELKEIVGWSMTLIVSALCISILKIWSWLEMEKYSLIREIKRVELQVAMLRDEKK